MFEFEIYQNPHGKQAAIGALKGLISCTPFGASLVGAWEGYQSSRLNDFVEKLSSEMIKLGEEKIDSQYMKSEEFFDFFNAALRSRLQSRSEKKAKIIIGMIGESMQKNRNERFDTSDKLSFLFLLDSLTDKEMDFLSQFFQGKYMEKSKDDIYQMEDYNLGIAIDGLLSKSILQEDNSWVKHLTLSMRGRAFMDYLKVLNNV